MNVDAGLHRIKVIWAVLCFGPALAIMAVLSFSHYRPDLMFEFSMISIFIAASLSIPPFLNLQLKTKLLIAFVGGAGGLAALSNLDRNQDILSGEVKPIAFAVFGIAVWLAWHAIEWIVRGFLKR